MIRELYVYNKYDMMWYYRELGVHVKYEWDKGTLSSY